MKKMILAFLFICVSFSVAQVAGKDGQSMGESEIEAPRTTMQGLPSQTGEVHTPPTADSQLKMREVELQKREMRVNNIASNSAEALQNFRMKTIEAKKQRIECLKSKAADIKSLEMERATGSASLSSCSPKNLQATLPRPVRPSLDGLSDTDKQTAIVAFQASLKEWYTQMQTAMKTCRTTVSTARLAIREQIIGIKEQCSNTERTVLGLSTEVPYNAQ